MNLIIDQGNTVCKVAVAIGRELHKHCTYPQLALRDVHQIFEAYPEITAAVYSSVARVDQALLGLLAERVPLVIEIGADTAVPLELRYDRARLGSDRLAAVVGAYARSRGAQELLVVDAGTAITIERVTASGVYLGGNISPGLYTRTKALNHFTSRLPLLTDLEDLSLGFGQSTQQAISRGVLQGIRYEIEGYIQSLRAAHPTAQVYLTGGDAALIKQTLELEVTLDPDLVLYGLNEILEYNKQ